MAAIAAAVEIYNEQIWHILTYTLYSTTYLQWQLIVNIATRMSSDIFVKDGQDTKYLSEKR